jgi:RNA-binding protein with serine-rich domain 1
MLITMNADIVNTNRGTAYILYVHEADAEAAIAHMHEAQLDGAVINVSIVLPRR